MRLNGRPLANNAPVDVTNLTQHPDGMAMGSAKGRLRRRAVTDVDFTGSEQAAAWVALRARRQRA